MRPEDMELMRIGDVTLETYCAGSGDPVLFVHGGMGDECAAVVDEPALAERYRLIHFHRRGWGRSERGEGPLTVQQQAADCRAVLEHFGVEKAHCVGQSYGGVILFQLASETPEVVRSLSVLEPSLPSVLLQSPEFGALFAKIESFKEAGDMAGALETFALGVSGDGFRAIFDQNLPPGYFERWVSDGSILLLEDAPEHFKFQLTQDEARGITPPVLNVVGANTWAPFRDCFETVKALIPQAENHELRDATHCMLQMNPRGAAERIDQFISSH